MKDRILQIINEVGLTASNFAKEIGVLPSTISHISSEDRNPSLDVVQKILNKYKNISPDWLLSGIGEMYRNEIDTTKFQTSKIKQTNFLGQLETQPSPTVNNQKLQENPLIEKFEHESIENINNTEIRPSEPINENLKIETKITLPELPTNEKNVKSIVIFYSDNTFEYFKPNTNLFSPT